MDSKKILDEINADATWLLQWGHAHTFIAGIIIGVVIDRVFGLFFF